MDKKHDTMGIDDALKLGSAHIAFKDKRGIQVYPVRSMVLTQGLPSGGGGYYVNHHEVSKRTWWVIVALLNAGTSVA